MVDAHCHLQNLEDPDLEIEKFKKSGGKLLICSGAGVKSSFEAVEIAKKYKGVWATVGVHPEEIVDNDVPDLEKLDDLVCWNVAAIGETGLDIYENTTSYELETQIRLFDYHIKLAKKHKRPLVVHCRNAYEKVYKMVKEGNLSGMLHCFTGSLEWANKFIALGWSLSIGGILTFKNDGGLRETIKKIPIDYLLTETDAPWLAPEPVRGSKNTPENVKYVVKTLADIKGMTIDEVNEKIYWNAMSLFD